MVQISFFGATNSGKSTLVNAIAGQQVALVSDRPGTTTDPVRKRIEIPGIGPVLLVDTAGYGDEGELGAERERLTRAVIDSTDVAVLLLSGHPADALWRQLLEDADIPVVPVIPRPQAECISFGDGDSLASLGMTEGALGMTEGALGMTEGAKESLLRRIAAAIPSEEERFLTGDLVRKGDIVVMVMPQDSEAPKGRIILPQVQVLRELLDRGCVPVCCTPETLPEAMTKKPDLVITDSQVFKQVDAAILADCPLTSFSILLAAAKGDIDVFVEGAKAIDGLRPGARVLIAEACTHVPDNEDIGRVKIPALLRKKTGDMQVDVAGGNDFPEDLSGYDLIIHCGACVAGKRLVRSRIKKALRAGVPITNYGIAIAALQGILGRVSLP
ncbi:MAG: [Bacteroidales bacterium]|nr:[FeFe] hydrogenase H-cluster maturation GTPase HydF [Bacteroidales bacterium]